MKYLMTIETEPGEYDEAIFICKCGHEQGYTLGAMESTEQAASHFEGRACPMCGHVDYITLDPAVYDGWRSGRCRR